MKIYKCIKDFNPVNNPVVTIGSFDGVHLGHRAILQQLIDKATELGLPSVVMIFEPQPQEFFSGEQAPARLMRLREKVEAFIEAGIDQVFCLHLNTLTGEVHTRRCLNVDL